MTIQVMKVNRPMARRRLSSRASTQLGFSRASCMGNGSHIKTRIVGQRDARLGPGRGSRALTALVFEHGVGGCGQAFTALEEIHAEASGQIGLRCADLERIGVALIADELA